MPQSDLKYLAYWCMDQFAPKQFDRNQAGEFNYFLHIPKAAGTSFRYVIYNSFPQYQIYPNYVDLATQYNMFLPWHQVVNNLDLYFPPHIKWLIGHFNWQPIQHFENQYKINVFAFFRDPLKRILSSIAFHKKRNRRYSGMSIDDILNQYLQHESRAQAIAMGYKPGKHNIEEVIERLEKLKFIGISSEFDRSIDLCNAQNNWQLIKAPAQNIGEYTHINLTQGQEDRILEATHATDQVVYQYAKEIFDRRCETYGV